jgi:predicted metal-dependent hydrolase
LSVARYAPQRAFPAYAYLPGRDPHPTGDPRGHSFSEHAEPPAAYFAPARWRENVDYLFGVDLYNHGYLWEAHEAWEGLWHSAKHDALQAEFLQGLIQCTAAALKVPMKQPEGLAKLSARALPRLERVARESSPHFMGLDVLDFVRSFRAFAESQPASADQRPRIVLG